MALPLYECQGTREPGPRPPASPLRGAGASRSSSSETWVACHTNQAATWVVARSARLTIAPRPAPYPRVAAANDRGRSENPALCGFTTLRRHDRRRDDGQDRGALQAP